MNKNAVFCVSLLILSLIISANYYIPTVKSSPDIHQGDLILTGNNVTIIEGRFDINGSIIVEDNATLILENAIVNFTQTFQYQYNITFRNPANGNPRLQAGNTTIVSDFYVYFAFYGNSSAVVSNLDARYMRLFDSAVAIVTNSSIFWLDVFGSAVASVFNSTIEGILYAASYSVVSVSNSTIKLLAIQAESVNCSIVNLGSKFFDFWDYCLNSSIIAAPSGHAPNVTIRYTAIDWWQFSLYGSSNATIINSTITYLHSYSYSVVRLINSTTSHIQYFMEGKVYVSWYLDVHVVDSIGQNVPSSNVTATYPNATVAESKIADANGWARLTLMEKMMNATGEYPVGNYTVGATYDVHIDETSVNLTRNKEITLQLDFVIPEFPSFLILLLLTVLSLITTFAYRRKFVLKV